MIGELGKEDAYKPERMTTLTSFSSLEISDLEVKGLILSFFTLGPQLSFLPFLRGREKETYNSQSHPPGLRERNH